MHKTEAEQTASMWLNDPLMTGTKSPVPNIRHTTLCHPERTSFWRSSVTLLWGGHPSISRSLLHSADTGGGSGGVEVRGEGYKQASHKRCCSNIPVQATDFHTVVQPNIGIGGVYRVHRCWEALSLIQRFRVGARTTVHTMRRRRIWQRGLWRDRDASTGGRLWITFWQQQPHNKRQTHSFCSLQSLWLECAFFIWTLCRVRDRSNRREHHRAAGSL